MKFNFADFDIRAEIDRRTDLEAWKEWGQKPTPVFEPMPDTTQYKEKDPPLLAIYNFALSLRP